MTNNHHNNSAACALIRAISPVDRVLSLAGCAHSVFTTIKTPVNPVNIRVLNRASDCLSGALGVRHAR